MVTRSLLSSLPGAPSTFRALAPLLLAVAALGCAGSFLDVQPIPVTANPTQQIDQLDSEVEQAREARLPILSPDWFGKAEASLREATRLRDEGGAVQEILDQVAQGRAQLAEAQRFAQVAASALPTVIQARADARKAGAPSLGERYAEVEGRFVELTRAVENDDLGWAQRKGKDVERAFRTIELEAIKETTGRQIADLIAQAKRAGAEKLAPRTLAEAQRSYQDLDAFITQNRYASDEIGKRAAEALFQAHRALNVTQEARRLKEGTPEQLALDEEFFLHNVARAMAAPDFRDRDFGVQRASVENAARELRNDRDHLVAQSEALRAETGRLEAEIALLEGQTDVERQRIAKLEDEKRFNDLYTEVSGYFAPEEAEVYKKGQQLVIRMRTIEFPVGSAVLLPPNYALLSKVQRAVRDFGSPMVIIEGHTDSTGSAEVNEQLSQSRAEAVAEYLVANNTLPRERVTAVGKGFSEPLASNRTEEGRATNRRIDVVIDAGSHLTPEVAAGPAAGSARGQ